MNLLPSDEQQIIATIASEFLTNEVPIARVRALGADSAAPAIDAALWKRCAELGWLGLSIPEAAGGVGFGLPEEIMLFREFGRHLTPGPFLPSILAAHIAARTGDHSLVSEIIAGDRRAGLAVGELAVNADPGGLLVVLEGAAAELFEIESYEAVDGIDPGTRFSRVAPGKRVAAVEDAALLDRARVLVAAEQLGIIEAVRDMSAAYAQTRTQFGKAIGSFQAVKHRCADMAIASVAVTSELYMAALLVENGAPEAAFHAANAYVLATGGAKTSTADNIQNHGAIGFTWEHDAHLFLNRALLLENLLGEQRRSYDAILAHPRYEFA
jgi:alkylation response protein AidB-like acyl-CoA dehydrogenase